ncbi:MAG: hypothetical protein A3C53_06110 [Omnitrophica WOR_2 bacterium RIFCSPHIGHO2_02_FULL_68_15]|nr:MAG: hypothetical protein A3C53_06110 [Omnitrophica WOR_2 bacterium RIFCSPHIGHO2_02_FULL_68_15]
MSSQTPERQSKPRILTVEQANRLLPEVRVFLAALRTQRAALETLEQAIAVMELEGLRADGTMDAARQAAAEAKAAECSTQMERFQETLHQLDAVGCQLKDLNAGLVDFFTVHQGQLVCLCWKDGEESVRFWHTLDDSFAGRRPITELANN